MTIFLATMIRPFLMLFLLACIVWPITWVINKYMPDSKLKRFLFKQRGID